MKGKIFMYLFIFAVLFILYQFMNAKKAKTAYDAKIGHLTTAVTTKEAVIDSLIDVNLDLMYFSLEGNEDANSYFEDKGYDAKKLALTISDQIIGQNAAGKDNPIVPFTGMSGGHMVINKVRLLNHKWILADFSDGKHWGELFIIYDLNEEGIVDFEVEKSFLYPLKN